MSVWALEFKNKTKTTEFKPRPFWLALTKLTEHIFPQQPTRLTHSVTALLPSVTQSACHLAKFPPIPCSKNRGCRKMVTILSQVGECKQFKFSSEL